MKVTNGANVHTTGNGYGLVASNDSTGSPAGGLIRGDTVGLLMPNRPDYLAAWISAVAIFPCAGGRDEASERAIIADFAGTLDCI